MNECDANLSALDANVTLQREICQELATVEQALEKTIMLRKRLLSPYLATAPQKDPWRMARYPFFVDKQRRVPNKNSDSLHLESSCDYVEALSKQPFWTHEKQQLAYEVKRENMRLLSNHGKYSVAHLSDRELLMNLDGINWNTHPLINKDPFSKEEITRLEKIASDHGHKDWVKIASEHGNGRVAAQCFKVYRKIINPDNVKYVAK
ncbi:hypothetical protein HDV05_003752 [Chytridiales sp. JEL 0842]|nr:hypothetical protein HDV05_003752 [Chytridiales sp. JEL 0842]